MPFVDPAVVQLCRALLAGTYRVERSQSDPGPGVRGGKTPDPDQLAEESRRGESNENNH